jgi:hypothetical protein
MLCGEGKKRGKGGEKGGKKKGKKGREEEEKRSYEIANGVGNVSSRVN